jgi:hypothetical protein
VIRALREERGLSHRSVVYTLGAIRQVLAYGIAENVLATNVASSVRAPRKQHGDSKPKIIWTPEELVRFRAVAQLHGVRHTIALIGHRAGQAPADMAALLGHTVAVHLARYVPLTERGAQTAASGLGAAIARVV